MDVANFEFLSKAENAEIAKIWRRLNELLNVKKMLTLREVNYSFQEIITEKYGTGNKAFEICTNIKEFKIVVDN